MSLAARHLPARTVEPFDIDDLAEGHLTLWLSSIGPAYYDLDGSLNVQTAFDRSPRGQDATQATSTARPSIISQGGRDWFDFSGGNHYLQTVAGTSSVSAASPVTSARTVFTVYYLPYATHPNTRRVMLESYSEWYGGINEIETDNDPVFSMYDGGVESADGATDVPLQQVVIQAGQFLINDFVYVWMDGVLLSGANAITTPVLSSQTGWMVGTYRSANARWFDGYLGEVVVIDRFLSSTDMALGFEILSRRWT